MTVYYQSNLSSYFTSFSYSPIVISVRVRNEIFRSGFLGAVVQLTHVLRNDVIEALASDVLIAGLNALRRGCCFYRLKDVFLERQTEDGIFPLALLSR